MQTGYVAAPSINDQHRDVMQRKIGDTRAFMLRKGLKHAYRLAIDNSGLVATLSITAEFGKEFEGEFSREVLNGNFEIHPTTKGGGTEFSFGYSPE